MYKPCAINARLADVLRCVRSFTNMDWSIRRAKREDCLAMLELIRELAAYERAPAEVTVSLEHFEESGFGEKPVWWAFVACASGKERTEAVAVEQEAVAAANTIQAPIVSRLVRDAPQPVSAGIEKVQTIKDGLLVEPVIQLDEPLVPVVPEPVMEALPLMQEALPCEKVIGFALYYIRYSTWKGRRIYLEDIIVTESCRGKGVGTALMDALIGAAKAERLQGISCQVLEWNEPAIKFYKRYGARFDSEWVNAAIDV